MKTNAKINLSFETSLSKKPKSISSKQFDNLTRTLTVRFGTEIPEESVVVLRGTKPDSAIFELVGKRLNDYEYLFEFTESALSVSGKIVCDVNCTLFENGVAKTCSTEIFFIENQSSAVNGIGEEDDRTNTVPLLIENALSDAKASGTFDGKDGKDGKSAYEYAVEGGYEGSEEDFSKKLAQDGLNYGTPANAVTKTVLGDILRIEDVIYEKQNVKVAVKTKNLVPIAPTQTINGMLFTVFGDGKIVISGTATVDVSFNIPMSIPANTYTFSMNNPYVLGGEMLTVILYSKTGAPICTVYPDTTNKTHVFKSTNEITFLSIKVPSGVTLNDFIMKPQIEIGSNSTLYTPITETANTVCSVFGKNLLPPLRLTQHANGLNITPNPDGTVTVGGSTAGSSVKTVFDLALLDENGNTEEVVLKAGKVYYLSVTKDGATYTSYKNEIYYPDTDETVYISNLGDKNRERILKRVYIERNLSTGSTILNGLYRIQLELGSGRSDYEQYVKEEYTSDENGFLEFNSIDPTMTVQTERNGTILELTYCQDTNSALNSIITALRAIGGNI